MELNLATQIENLKNPPIVNLPLPWVSTPTEVPVFEEPTTTLENEETI
jgi:hypothetical protein